MKATAPVMAGTAAAGIAFIVIFLLYWPVTAKVDDSVSQGPEKVISVTKNLPIAKEFVRRYPDATIEASQNQTDLSKYPKYDLAAIVTYSVERTLSPSGVHKELRLNILLDKKLDVDSSGMTCLGPVSGDLSRVEPDMWLEAQSCLTNLPVHTDR